MIQEQKKSVTGADEEGNDTEKGVGLWPVRADQDVQAAACETSPMRSHSMTDCLRGST